VPDWTVEQLQALTQEENIRGDLPKQEAIAAFWAALRGMTTVERAGVLAFATGRSRLPAGGSGGGGGGATPVALRLDVKPSGRDSDLPTASTCSLALHLPPLSDAGRMAAALRIAVQFTGTIDGDYTSGGGSVLQLLHVAPPGMAAPGVTAGGAAGGPWLLRPLWPDPLEADAGAGADDAPPAAPPAPAFGSAGIGGVDGDDVIYAVEGGSEGDASRSTSPESAAAHQRDVLEEYLRWRAAPANASRFGVLPDSEAPQLRRIRFRTLGCYPLTAGVLSDATTLDDILREMLETKLSERQGRLIDSDEANSMEAKKREGYF
jgi:hypothetical protein